jgi:hypothetical protein
MAILAEQNEVLSDFTARLEQLGIPYMLTGSMAMMHYAIPRIVVAVSRAGANGHQTMVNIINSDGYKKVIQLAFDSLNNLTHFDPKKLR